MGKQLFIFDDNNVWGASLSERLADLIPTGVASTIRTNEPRYMEDAADILFSAIGPEKQQLIVAVASWIESQTLAVYHGSRLDDSDLENIRSEGLRALVPESRRNHLEKKLSRHPRWEAVKAELGPILEKLGKQRDAGERGGQVHATLSRAGLLNGFNHYLTHGSEFDQHASFRLLKQEGMEMELLGKYGRPVLITLAVPGAKALDAANPFREIGGEIPNVVREIIKVWSYWLAYPDFSAASQRFDCGFMFYQDIPAEWIYSIEKIELAEPPGG